MTSPLMYKVERFAKEEGGGEIGRWRRCLPATLRVLKG